MTIRGMGHYGFEQLMLSWGPRGLSDAMGGRVALVSKARLILPARAG